MKQWLRAWDSIRIVGLLVSLTDKRHKTSRVRSFSYVFLYSFSISQKGFHTFKPYAVLFLSFRSHFSQRTDVPRSLTPKIWAIGPYFQKTFAPQRPYIVGNMSSLLEIGPLKNILFTVYCYELKNREAFSKPGS